ncbi:MAG TPA: VWA domain-containing protein [Vicinamibacterales bacterium]|nr:VWA domain-containing protein [Vicinamibacterales bacterium]
MSIWMTRRPLAAIGLVTAVLGSSLLAQERQSGQGFSFRTSVDLVSVNASVTDRTGHFVPGLRVEDFTIEEDGERQTITQFETERVPVSLGIVLDTSGSMSGEKMTAAREALGRFVFDLLGPKDEMFLYRFDSRPILVQGWTEDRRALMRALGSVTPAGGTALYDTVAEAIPLAASGTRRKKALVVISDGNDTNSEIALSEVRQLIRESEVMVYAIGIEGSGGAGASRSPAPTSLPWPWPGGPIQLPWPGRPRPQPPTRTPSAGANERVNAQALRMLSDDSGGRTEIVQGARNLDQATAGIASELSQQYFLGYVSTRPKDGRWHNITVQVRQGNYQVRARRGFVAG